MVCADELCLNLLDFMWTGRDSCTEVQMACEADVLLSVGCECRLVGTPAESAPFLSHVPSLRSFFAGK